jgi:hypothetical protein
VAAVLLTPPVARRGTPERLLREVPKPPSLGIPVGALALVGGLAVLGGLVGVVLILQAARRAGDTKRAAGTRRPQSPRRSGRR